MGSIAEQSRWAPDIYRIQTTDPVLGGQDGIINIQPEQVASRTLYLKDRLEQEHSPDGEHCVTDSQVADIAGIQEAKLALDIPTADLSDDFALANEAMLRLKDEVEAIVGKNGFFVDGLSKVMQLNWKYGDWGFDFEFFSDGLTMRDMRNVDARSAIGRDDSVDCEDTSGIVPGMRLIISDGTRREEVEVRSVLERGRIRLVHDLAYTYDEPAFLGYTDWDLGTPGVAVVRNGRVFYSRMTPVLQNAALGSLLICRDAGAGALKVQYRDTGEDGEWITVECDRVFPHDTDAAKCYEHYTVIGTNVQLRIEGASETEARVHHMVLFPEPFRNLESFIRKPDVVYPEDASEAWQDMILLESSPFLSAYRDYYVQTEYGLFDAATGALAHTISCRTRDFHIREDATGMPPAGEYLVRCRHQSDVSEWSSWSNPVRITLHAARVLFGFAGTANGRAFNDAPMDSLGFYPIHFGFEGAKLSGGFDSVSFTTNIED
jgi:hypothetical protein